LLPVIEPPPEADAAAVGFANGLPPVIEVPPVVFAGVAAGCAAAAGVAVAADETDSVCVTTFKPV
jgi:hypothetical protein